MIVRKPLQDRSQRSLEALLDATECLMEERRFEQIPVAEILLKAGVSNGSFYARFSSKDALLPALYARYHAELPGHIRRLEQEFAKASPSLADACRLVVDLFIAFFEGRVNLMRAIALYARTRPEEVRPFLGARSDLHQQMVDQFRRYHGEIASTDPEQAVRTGLFVVGTVAREAVLFPDAPTAAVTGQSRAALRRTLAGMFHSHLTTAEDPA